MVSIKLEKVVIRRNNTLILDNINFTSSKPEVIALLGANGSGKTTFIKTIIGLFRPINGSVSCNIDNISKLSDLRNNISLVLDTAGLYENLSVYDNLQFYCNLLRLHNSNNLITNALTKVDLLPFSSKKVKNLSKGQKQRLSIARCLLKDYQLLFFDEPTLGLDYDANEMLIKLISEWKNNNSKTIFVSSHDFNFIQNICDRVVLFGNNTIQYDEKLTSILSNFSSLEEWYKEKRENI